MSNDISKNLDEIFNFEQIDETSNTKIIIQPTFPNTISNVVVSNSTVVVGNTSNTDIVDTSFMNVDTSKELEEDFKLSRKAFHSLMKKGEAMFDEAYMIARETENPRAFEVAATALKNLGETAEKLMNVHEKLKMIRENKRKSDMLNNGVSIDKAVFIGKPADLIKKLRDSKDE